ncbi:MAG: hypothetical protein CL916_00510 [Deltaproteobacteria bacterium]|nr:hypothetical protein [Deltaproteobacteria bacterium]
MKCEVMVGQLISRPCGMKTTLSCPECSLNVCSEHFDEERKMCVSCSGELNISKGMLDMDELLHFEQEELRVFDTEKHFDVTYEYLDS